jgi:transcription-repair coupling factor (superfamily II helicase)
VVSETVEERGGEFLVAGKDLHPLREGQVGGDQHAALLVAVREQVEEQFAARAIEGHESEFVVDLPAFLPDDFIPDTGQRVELYRRLAQSTDEDQVRATLEEIVDRYAPLPDEAVMLGEVMAQKTLVRRLGAGSYDLSATRLVVGFDADAAL